ncbi:MAG: NADP-specific glutamate dehydrogenase [Thioalkalispiraceae bacterium]|jgi:glutamate dehydrogenase (NADP+)
MLTKLFNKHSARFGVDDIVASLQARYPRMPEFHQSVRDVSEDIMPYVNEQKSESLYQALHYLTEPDQVVSFRVNWQDDNNRMQFNRGYRVQFSNALGPYKGGLRLDPKLNLSVLYFLGFEQTFKNSLTGLPMGGAKGGADFDPHGKSEAEIQRFCRAFMTQLARHIGPETDVPAGDIGVSTREIAYLFDQYRTITGKFSGVLTGKAPVFGGSCFREEATGYGCVYFAEQVLAHKDAGLADQTCAISGAGNVALYTAEKLIELGAKVITLSDRQGVAHFAQGLTQEQLSQIRQHRYQRGTLKSLSKQEGWQFHARAKPWSLETDLAFACATQNELELADAKQLVKNSCQAVFEGANMPCTSEAVDYLREASITLAPSKAVNAGGVAVSGLEISQNNLRMPWQADEVEQELQRIMRNIHESCVEHGTTQAGVDYKQGANIAAFLKLSEAIELYGLA